MTIKVVSPEKALEHWSAKITISPETFYALLSEIRGSAFTVSGLMTLDMVSSVYDSIQEAIAEGRTMEQWKAGLDEEFAKKGWAKDQPWRVENVFRTNIQSAYAAGRYRKMSQQIETFPYWMYSAVRDSRTRIVHLLQHGKTYPADHEYWTVWYPLNGFMCRCGVISLSRMKVKKLGLKIEKNMPSGLIHTDPRSGEKLKVPVQMAPDKGFETNQAAEAFKPDLSKYPAVLRKQFEERQRSRSNE